MKVVTWRETAGTAQMSRKNKMEQKKSLLRLYDKIVVIGGEGIWKEDVYNF